MNPTTTQVDQRVSLAVSTVIFALRPHPSTGRDTLWLPLVRRIREPYEGAWALPGGPLEADEDLAASPATPSNARPGSPPTTWSSCTPSARSTARPARPRSCLDRLLGAGAARRGGPRRGRRERRVVRRRRGPAAGVRPQPDRRVRARPAARQDHLLPDRARVPQPRVHPRRAARGARGRAAQAARPRQLPPPGAGQQDPRPHRHLPHRHQPPTTGPVPLRSTATEERP